MLKKTVGNWVDGDGIATVQRARQQGSAPIGVASQGR